VSTAYLFPSTLQGLADVSVSPGVGQDGYPLIWNNTASKWVTDVFPGNMNLAVSNPNKVLVTPFLRVNVDDAPGTQTGIEAYLESSQNNSRQGFFLNKEITNTDGAIAGLGFAAIYNGTTVANRILPTFAGKSFGVLEGSSLSFIGFQHPLETDQVPVLTFDFRKGAPTGSSNLSDNAQGIAFQNRAVTRWSMRGNGNISQVGTLAVNNTAASTSTTTGALVTTGGAGIGGALHVGGQINGLGAVQSGTPASATAAGTQGQIRWNANYIYVCTAANTWKRVAISNW